MDIAESGFAGFRLDSAVLAELGGRVGARLIGSGVAGCAMFSLGVLVGFVGGSVLLGGCAATRDDGLERWASSMSF